jgi:hypothetical protein
MHIAWTKGLKGKDKEERIQQVLNYRNTFDDLREVLLATCKKKDADREYNEGWQQRQIAANEYNAALEDILKIITLKPKG